MDNHGTVAPDTYERLLSHLLSTVSREHVGIARKKAAWWSRAGHGLVSTPGGVKRGRGVKPASGRVIQRRPHAMTRSERFDLECRIDAVTQTMLSPVDPLDDPSDLRLKDIGARPRGHAGRPSIRQVQAALKPANGSEGPGLKVVATAYAGLYGTPQRAAKARALPSSDARDLFPVLDSELPVSRVSAVAIDDLVAKLWEPRTGGARATARWRTRKALGQIAAAGLLNVGYVGNVVIIGRARRVPVDAEAQLRTGTIKLRSISRGRVDRRQGIWGTEEGIVAQLVAIAVLDDHEVCVHEELATVAGTHIDADEEDLAAWAYAPYAASRKPGLTQAQREDLIAQHRRRADHYRASVSAGERLMRAIWDGRTAGGVAGAFEGVTAFPYLVNKTSKDPLSAKRIAVLSRKLRSITSHEDMTALIAADARQRGRPTVNVVTPAPAAPIVIVEPACHVPTVPALEMPAEPLYSTSEMQRRAPFFVPRFLFDDDVTDEAYDHFIHCGHDLPTAPRFS